MSSRTTNERKFGSWETTATGCTPSTAAGNQAAIDPSAYRKEVDDKEKTIRFWQEIFDESGRLREVHEKFPVDRGHRKV